MIKKETNLRLSLTLSSHHILRQSKSCFWVSDFLIFSIPLPCPCFTPQIKNLQNLLTHLHFTTKSNPIKLFPTASCRLGPFSLLEPHQSFCQKPWPQHCAVKRALHLLVPSGLLTPSRKGRSGDLVFGSDPSRNPLEHLMWNCCLFQPPILYISPPFPHCLSQPHLNGWSSHDSSDTERHPSGHWLLVRVDLGTPALRSRE